MEKQTNTIGKALKKYLRAEGISQEKAADQLNISRQTLSEYFNRVEFPTDTLQTVKKTWPEFAVPAADIDSKPHPRQTLDNPITGTITTSQPEDPNETIALLRQVAEAERTARIEAQEAKLAEREAKEAYKEIARLKEAPSSDAFYKKLEDRDEKLQSLLEQALPLLGGLRDGLSAVQEHELLINDTFEWIVESLSSEEAMRDMWKNRADRILNDLNKSVLKYREEQRQGIPSLQGT